MYYAYYYYVLCVVYKCVLSALGRLADGPAQPISPSNRTPIFGSTLTRSIYIYDRQAEQRRHALWEKFGPLSQ